MGSLQPHAPCLFPVRAGQQHRHGTPVVQRARHHAALDQMRFTMVQRAPDGARATEGRMPKVTLARVAPPPEVRPSPPPAPEASGSNGSETRTAAAARTASEKPKPAKRPKKAVP